MGHHSKVALAAVGLAITFAVSARASSKKSLTACDDDPAGTPSPSANMVVPVVAFTSAELGNLPAAQERTELDAADPWSAATAASAAPKKFALAHAPKKSKPRPLDTTDPWAGLADPWGSPGSTSISTPTSASPPRAHTRAAAEPSTPARAADDALREAVKRAIDAGDLDRAAKLIEILRFSR